MENEDSASGIFVGVHFVLLGFDSISQQKIRSMIVDGGGVDAGRYGPHCTHVIVDKVVYDDPICVAARSDGKTLVTGLWVQHSFDVGMRVDPSSILYRPLRDLNGIPGAKSFVVCLTGYQRQDREDIMTMVGLMGANFSKPLVANKVTHLICYKFEGEKYELAKKLMKIKLINHRWLEDCLRTWQILPEADYDKSGYELDMMEAQAKDSEDEAQDIDTKQKGEKGVIAISESLSAKEKEAECEQIQSQKATPSRCVEVLGSFDSTTGRKSRSGVSLNSLDETLLPENGCELTSASNSNKKSPLSDASKLSAPSYSRKTPRKASLPLEPVQSESNAGSSPVANLGKHRVSDCLILSSSKKEEDGTVSNGVKSPLMKILSPMRDGQSGLLPVKRKADIPSSSSKLQRTEHISDFISEGSVVVESAGKLAPEPLMNELLGVISHSPENDSCFVAKSADLSHVQHCAYNILDKVIPEIRPQISSEKRKSIQLDDKPESANVCSSRPETAVNDSSKPQNTLQDESLPPATKVIEVAKSNTTVGSDFPGGDASSRSKPHGRKLLAKKTLGSKPSFGRGKALNQKGSIYINEKVSPKNSASTSLAQNETEDPEKFVSPESIEVGPPTSDAEMHEDIKVASESGNEEKIGIGLMDDETEAPENKEDNEINAMVNEEKFSDIKGPNSVNTRAGEKAGTKNIQNDDSIMDLEDQVVSSAAPGERTDQSELVFGGNAEEENIMRGKKCRLTTTKKKNLPKVARLGKSMEGNRTSGPFSGKRTEESESVLRDNTGEENIMNGRKGPLTTNKKNSVPIGAKLGKSKEGDRRKGAKFELNSEKAKTTNTTESHVVVDRDMTPAPVGMTNNSVEVEKENRSVHTGGTNVNHDKQKVGKLTRRSNIKSLKSDGAEPGSESVGQILKAKIEPVWFILSGHKLQRKEFQKVIKHLKGSVCRDSHQWSYQATHFIVPDPIRRTEKFFAAAASGRWILKTDYLTASNEAGRFLTEEPYEWHKKGLSEDGAINLEAPRKWRLLRERTGHGAFYKMRIIIYGECIAPPLDTLKRVVKGGDGIILATSPPYTRFLQSGVDFAIVSSGMPRVDIWVQEFLRHEIPCVSADYLVEYVCKPGYSLDRHVQYNTLAWAEKSLKNLVNRMEEIVEDSTPEEDDDDNNDDITCQVCGSRDRGDVMLICGDESGSSGCGIGTHIDCCDPPLEEIPEGNWYCSKCRNRNTKRALKDYGISISTSKRQ
ncbi:hypothetical protein ACH5RR_010848 [Cinchona calisaya]|uniref:BRCT domain-containing protein n=1 Tax=Cinchona calisaya TaxID=153742 RepID=A0ABD3AK15_9GENT